MRNTMRHAAPCVAIMTLACLCAIAEDPAPPAVKGMIIGTGTQFQVLDSEYLDVTLVSSEPIRLMLESVPSSIIMHLEAADGATSTWITVSGLEPSTTYYRYEDSYRNGVTITADATGSCSWSQQLSGAHAVWLQLHPSTKFIRDDSTGGDCGAIGTWDAGVKTCSLTGNVYESIVIESDNITLDGAGFAVQGGGAYGIYLRNRSGVSIRDVNVVGFNYGIHLMYSSGNSLIGNTATNSGSAGIWLYKESSENALIGNTTFNQGFTGIWLFLNSGNSLIGNRASTARQGAITLYSSSGNTLQDNSATDGGYYGVMLHLSTDNLVTGNTISDNARVGLWLIANANNNRIYNNRFIDNPVQAQATHGSTNNTFNLDAPVGGNFWNDWTSPDADGDRFVDDPYVFAGGSDDLPWALPDGWLNRAPLASAGENSQIPSTSLAYSIVFGEANDPDGDLLQFRWLEDEVVLLDWTEVDSSGAAYLDLGLFPELSIGDHTLTLEVSDGEYTTTDTMILTIDNSPPEVQAAPSTQVVEVGIDPITFVADVADFDGDTVSYVCLIGSEILYAGTVETIYGGETVRIPDILVEPGDPRFPLDTHVVELQFHDGVNDPVSAFVTVQVNDSTAPSISPLPDVTMLWPPNHTLRPVTVVANANDNGGGTIQLDVSVSSSELPDFDGDGNTIPDYYIDSIDNVTGTIQLRLRSERKGMGGGRTYTIVIEAMDESGNESQAQVIVRAPHDRRKK